MEMYRSQGSLGDFLKSVKWPIDFFRLDDLNDFLNKVYVLDYNNTSLDIGFFSAIWLAFKGELAFSLPGVDGVKIVLGGESPGYTFITGNLTVSENIEFELHNISIALRFDSEILKPVVLKSGEPVHPFAEIRIEGSIKVSSLFDVKVEGFDSIKLTPVMIGDTGIVISADDVKLDLSRTSTLPEVKAAGFDESFIGIYIGEARLQLPKELSSFVPKDIFLKNAAIGSGGISGEVDLKSAPTFNEKAKKFTGPGSGELFGIPFGLEKLDIKLKQNVFKECSITGQLLLPFFEKRVNVETGLSLDGGFSAKMTGVVEPGDSMTNGLCTLKKTGLLEITLESLGLEVQGDVFSAKLSGQLTPLFAKDQGLDWPSFQVNELVIDSDGNVHLDGGWLNLREQYSLDFYGFQFEITKLGFGKTDDGGKWAGFSGGLKLVDGLPVGASVEGLRLTWYEDGRGPQISFNGIGVEFEVPDVLRFKGAVAYQKLSDTEHRFAGDIKLQLLALDLEVDCQLIIGKRAGDVYMGIYLGMELPAGIPLWSTGLALYGMAGLFAYQMEPNKTEQEAWYGIDKAKSWYHRGSPGVTDLDKKWDPHPGSLALGAGVTLGTVSDNGYAFSGRMLLVIVFPGPILLIEGRANMLKKRSQLTGNKEPDFRALAVLDARAGAFLIGIDAQYKYGSGGQLLEIGGSAEVFFNLHDASAWHLYLGQKEPRDKRIRARIFKLFESNSYLMLDANSLAFGSWVGYGNRWKFGPLKVTLEAWLEYNVGLSWNPPQLHGDISLHGKAELAVFWFDLGLSLDAVLAADVFDPFHLLGDLRVGINLPWPLPDFSVGITLEWGPDLDCPPLPKPLKEVAGEHLKTTASWPLPTGKLLLPVYDTDGDGFIDQKSPSGPNVPPLNSIPVVPLDCRPHLTFTRPVHDDARIGSNPQPPNPEWERIGDPEKNQGPIKVRYGLKKITLERLDELSQKWHSWVCFKLTEQSFEMLIHENIPDNILVNLKSLENKEIIGEENFLDAIKKQIGREQTVRYKTLILKHTQNYRPFGSWAPVPAMPDGGGKSVAQTKLWLWSKTPFDYTRHSGRFWGEWFSDRFPDYPCLPTPPDKEIWYDFQDMNPAVQLISPWKHPEEKHLIFQWIGPQNHSVSILPAAIESRTHALCFANMVRLPEGELLHNEVTILLPQPAKAVKLIVQKHLGLQVVAYNADGVQVGLGQASGSSCVEVHGKKITRIVMRNGDFPFCLLAVGLVIGLDEDETMGRLEMIGHVRNEMARWQQTDVILGPHSTYRLKIVTTVQAQGEGKLSSYSENLELEEFAYFRTEGPPGLARLSEPAAVTADKDVSRALENLTLYVQQTIPATVPPQGQQPLLPRPVYRAYDVGVEFNENYVDLMYRIARRDLGLYLYDNNNRPVRDACGRLIVLSNRWGKIEKLTLDRGELRWILTLNSSTCTPSLDVGSIPHDSTLTSGADVQVLDPDTVYEARLVPLLLHEDFSRFPAGTVIKGPAGKLNGWQVYDEGHKDGPSQWEIGQTGSPAGFYILQTSNLWGGNQNAADARKSGTYLLRDTDGTWTDYRLNVYVCSEDNGAIGVVFRYVDPKNCYVFSMDRERKYRRLVRVFKHEYTILAQDDFVYVQNRDYLITVEAIGPSLRIYQDGTLVFSISDNSLLRGTIGLYCWGNAGAQFHDVRVDDFRKNAPVPYRFQFTTSQFANFFHHIHSFQDETWQQELPANADVKALFTGAAVSPAIKPSEEEARHYQELLNKVFETTARQNPKEVQVTRIFNQTRQFLVFLVESPEPIDWKRTTLKVLYTSHSLPKPTLPDTVKLTDVTFGSRQPNEESVSVLLRDTSDLSQHRIEYRKLPGPIAEPTSDSVMLFDDFRNVDGGLLFRDDFGPNMLDHYTIVDEGSENRPSQWVLEQLNSGRVLLIQGSRIYGGNVNGDELELPGTMAITGSEKWANIRMSVTLRSQSSGAIGVVFRYQDQQHYYRFSMGNYQTGSYFRLSKNAGGEFQRLWQQEKELQLGHSYHLVIEAYDNRLLGYLDNVLLFSIQDDGISAGQVGFYCWQNSAACFETLEIESLESDPVLWQPVFNDLSELDIVDEADAIQGLSVWEVDEGVLVQLSNIMGTEETSSSPSILQPGTYALGGNGEWEDVQISVRFFSVEAGAMGVMFRVSPHVDSEDEQGDYNYYCFYLGFGRHPSQLFKKNGQTVTSLWSDFIPYIIGQLFELTIRAKGSELRLYLDGKLLFTIYDDDLKHGRIGLCSSANRGARFERVVITDQTRRVGRWIIKDEGSVNAPSVWRISHAALLQIADISGGAEPECPGTYALAGESTWTDYRLKVRLRSDDDDALGLMFRYVDVENYYRLSIDTHRRSCQLIKKKQGVVTILDEKSRTYTPGETFTLTVDAIGMRLVCYMDTELLFDVPDASHAAGKVGLYCWKNEAARFEEVEVYRPPLDAFALLRDRFADNSTNGWKVVDEGTELGPSQWKIIAGEFCQTTDIYTPLIDDHTLSRQGTVAIAGDLAWSDMIISVRLRSLDDDAIGLVFRYSDENHYYRFSMDSQCHYRRLVKNVGGNFSCLWEDDFAYTVGQAYDVTIVAIDNTLRGYFDGVPMFVVKDDDLISGQIGLYCCENHNARFSQVRVYPADLAFRDWLLDETFENLIPDQWTFVDEGNEQGPSHWDLADGELCQTSRIYGESIDDNVIDKPGTYALTGETSWTDYRISVKLRSDDEDGAIGIMFRYKDADNYYRFSMDRKHRYRCLIKKVAGVVTELKRDHVQYIPGREYILTIDCVGGQLAVYLDGVEVFAVEDNDVSAGQIGLYCWANPGSRFAEVRVAAPAWVPYYTFGREEKMSAGTRVQVYAGNRKDLSQEEAGVIQRFIASLDESGQLRLSSYGADLRLRAPGAVKGHSRRFLTKENYKTVTDAKVLRKADGTGFFVVVPTVSSEASQLPAGQYRLVMTYRRNNQTQDPASQVFRQAGNSDPEKVTIDIP